MHNAAVTSAGETSIRVLILDLDGTVFADPDGVVLASSARTGDGLRRVMAVLDEAGLTALLSRVGRTMRHADFPARGPKPA